MAHHPSVEDLPDEDRIRRGMLPEGWTGQALAQTSCFFPLLVRRWLAIISYKPSKFVFPNAFFLHLGLNNVA